MLLYALQKRATPRVGRVPRRDGADPARHLDSDRAGHAPRVRGGGLYSARRGAAARDFTERRGAMTRKRSTRRRDAPLMIFDEMTSPEVAEAIRAGAPIMVAAGATEQHGDHLPLNSDTLQGTDIGKRVARQLA